MFLLRKVKALLSGKKSYIVSIIFAASEVAQSFEWIKLTDAQDAMVTAFILTLFGIAMRSAISKSK